MRDSVRWHTADPDSMDMWCPTYRCHSLAQGCSETLKAMTDVSIVAAWQVPLAELPRHLFHNTRLLKDSKTLWCPLWTAQGELQVLIYVRARVEKPKSCTWEWQKRGRKGRQAWKSYFQRFSLTWHHSKQCQRSWLPQRKWLAINADITREGGQVTALQQQIPSSNANSNNKEYVCHLQHSSLC